MSQLPGYPPPPMVIYAVPAIAGMIVALAGICAWVTDRTARRGHELQLATSTAEATERLVGGVMEALGSAVAGAVKDALAAMAEATVAATTPPVMQAPSAQSTEQLARTLLAEVPDWSRVQEVNPDSYSHVPFDPTDIYLPDPNPDFNRDRVAGADEMPGNLGNIGRL